MARRKPMTLPKSELNITSMMDLVLNLLLFFVLVSNFAAAELPRLNPPNPTDSLARLSEAPNKITVNVIPMEGTQGKAKTVKVGLDELSPQDSVRLAELLAHEVGISKDVEVDLRADKSLLYEEIQPVMAAITRAGISKINVVAMRGE